MRTAAPYESRRVTPGRRSPPGWLPACALLASALLAGCGDSGPSEPNATLSGSVSLDGAPIAAGTINFLPEGSGQAPPTSAEIVDGRYEARHVPLGKVRVMFSATRETGKMITEYSEPYPEVVSIIPPAHRQGEVIDVTGDGTRDFALMSE